MPARARWALLPALVLAVGCSSSHNATPPTTTDEGGLIPVPTTEVVAKALQSSHIKRAIEVAQAIKASGIGCNNASLDWQGIPPAKRPPQLPDEVSCDVGGNTVTVTLFKDPDALTSESSVIHQEACAGSPHATIHYVAGSNWVLFPSVPDPNDTARRLAGALPGAFRTIKC